MIALYAHGRPNIYNLVQYVQCQEYVYPYYTTVSTYEMHDSWDANMYN